MSAEPTVALILVAAGSGTRLGAGVPKAFVSVGGRSMLEHALEGVFATEQQLQVVVVAPHERLDEARAVAVSVAGAAIANVTVVAGGETRQQSVAAGLAVLGDAVDCVLVHDAARALTPASQIDAVARAVRAHGVGIVPAVPVVDSIKRVDDDLVLGPVDRAELAAVQTPQGFPRAVLVAAYADAAADHTDDAALFAAAGHQVRTVPGDPAAFKITTPWDLRRAELLLAPQPLMSQPLAPAPDFRTGIGVDVHAVDESAPLWLGTVEWPGEPGLSGHSDGDAIAHAICDALLSAAGLGDLGSRFGTDDPRYAGAHGAVFLTETASLVRAAGYSIANVAVQAVARRPRIGPRRLEIEQRLRDILDAPVSVSATTSDGLGFTGRGEGVTAIATALLVAGGPGYRADTAD